MKSRLPTFDISKWKLLKNLTNILGIDKAIGFSIIGRSWQAISGFVTILLIAKLLNQVDQGYYYTFSSILAIQIFFDLGLSFVVMQFTSHEKSKLEWTSTHILDGDPIAKSNVASVLRKALKWYGTAAAIALIVLNAVGFLFFSLGTKPNNSTNWQIPWAWLVISASGSLFMSPLYAIIEGSGKVAELAIIRTVQNVAISLAIWISLLLGLKLYATPISSTAGLICGLIWITVKYRHLFRDLLQFGRVNRNSINWRKDIWSFQWRIALSWLSGFFISYLFNPVLFAFHGPVIAGQMGMSVSVSTGLSSIATTWMSTKSAPFGSIIAQKEFKKLDSVFFKTLWQSFIVLVAGGVFFWVGIMLLRGRQLPLSARVLAPLPLGLLILTAYVNHFITAEAIYLRAHKEEPFVWLSLFGGVSNALSTYFLGRYFGPIGITSGYFALTFFIGLGFGTSIFLQRRHEWHREGR